MACIHITGGQALKLLRAARAKELVAAVPCDSVRVRTTQGAIESLNNLGINRLLSWLDIGPQNPLEVLVPNVGSRSWMSCVKTKVLSRDVPQGAFLELTSGTAHNAIVFPSNVRVFVDAPPLALVNEAHRLSKVTASKLASLKETTQRLSAQRHLVQTSLPMRTGSLAHPAKDAPLMYGADNHSVILATQSLCPEDGFRELKLLEELAESLQLIALASEFCGSYARDPLQPMTKDCHHDEPRQCRRFVTPEELNEFLLAAPRMDGINLARTAAEYAIDESGSPIETLCNLAWTLPPRKAGLSMPKPLVNKQLVVEDRRLRELLDQKSLRPDLQWPDYHTLVEYLGDKDHASHNARVQDKNRLQNYVAAEYTPFFLMFDDVKNVAAINRTALRIARELQKHGKHREVSRVSRIIKSPGFRERQLKLMATLLPPVTRYDQ